ncbi:uncharacterized protein LOC111267272 [Varroa jacobsoni]|uniref:Uncharacterized protein n=1 Tax=Varroa destructor TaxID=109461 RepID=A0A7M7JUU8_VARDE|nr:uncharacterized protein LOC111248822 [Varroa destructor]XP_022701148.1 uncharacterized protein LOC111267272 [Varroa jacobsoni]
MSNFPTVSQGMQFAIDATLDTDNIPSFNPHTLRHSRGRNPFVQQQKGGRNAPRGNFSPSEHLSSRGSYTPRGNFTPRGGQLGVSGSQNTPRHFYGRRRGGNRETDNFTNQESHSPRGNRSGCREGGPWSPRQPQPNFSNPYENQLTPRQVYTPRQRWTYTPRGSSTTMSNQFGPCAQGASYQTLALIDAFVKPSMLDNPWKYLEQQQKRSTIRRHETAGEPSYKKIRAEVEPDRSPPLEDDEVDDDAETEDVGSWASRSGEWKSRSSNDGQPDKDNDIDDDFNIKNFLPKV